MRPGTSITVKDVPPPKAKKNILFVYVWEGKKFDRMYAYYGKEKRLVLLTPKIGWR